MPLSESQTLIAQQLINYANLPVIRQAMCDPSTGEFMFMMKRRKGCPLSEKELKRQLADCYRAYIRDAISDLTARRALREAIPLLDVASLKEYLEAILLKEAELSRS